MIRALTITIAALALARPSAANQRAVSAAPITAFAHVADGFEADARKEQVVGGAMALVQDGKIVAERHFGLADRAAKQPVDEDTIFHWASITKTFTAIALMQLVDRGLIGIDDPVVKYIPEFAQAHNPYGPISDVTVRHLVTHSSGLREATWPWNTDGEDKRPGGQPLEPPGWAQLAAMFPYTGLKFAPGTAYAYSNPGLTLAGEIVERVSGDDIEVYVDKNILKPLGMTRTYFDITPRRLQHDRSNSYVARDGKIVALGREFDTGVTTGNGGLNAPIGDMVKYMNFLLDTGRKPVYDAVLSRKTLETMWQPRFVTDDATVSEHMGEAFFIIDANGDDGKRRRYIGHTGSQQGFRSFFYIRPGTTTGVIMVVNTTNATPRPLLFDARKALFEQVFPLFDKRH